MNIEKPLKSILKKTTSLDITSKPDRNREVALQHANIIQQRKNFELQILSSIEILIDYPLASSPADASNPSTNDIRKFRELIRSFQPSDYDSLVVERNINERCGYTLCPNRRHKEECGRYRILGTNGRANNLRIIKKENLEKWCSDKCALRAMYVRVQLNELPAWDRGIAEAETYIDLLVGPNAEELNVHSNSNGVDDAFQESINSHPFSYQTSKDGINVNKFKNMSQALAIREKQSVNPVQPPHLNSSGTNDSFLYLEGHKVNTEILNNHSFKVK